MVEASKAYVEVTSLTFKILIAENGCIGKHLQEAKQRIE